jgi:hypothetical protein
MTEGLSLKGVSKMDEEIIQGKHIDEFPEVQPDRLLSEEETRNCLDLVVDYRTTDKNGKPAMYYGGDFPGVYKRIKVAQDAKTASIVRAETMKEVLGDDFDPQAERVGHLIDKGWIPPEEGRMMRAEERKKIFANIKQHTISTRPDKNAPGWIKITLNYLGEYWQNFEKGEL